jgi:hypothetical protein
MNRKFVLGVLFIAAIFTLIGTLSAQTEEKNSLSPSLSTTLVISQVYSGGGGSTGTYLNDYVEIKNISSSSQSLNGLSLMYGSATGQFGSAATLIFALPNVTLAPGKYYLVQTSAAGSAGMPLPVTPDAMTTNLSMAAASGKVAITNSTFMPNTCGATATPCTLPNAGIIDLVSWGASNNAEGSVTVNNGTALTSVQGSVRKTGGCTETDNNNADFDVVTAPVPRNSATAAAPCGPVVAPQKRPLDFDGDGRTDFSVVRNFATGGQYLWYNKLNNAAGTESAVAWGFATASGGDTLTPEDFDGDGKTDVAVWRPDVATVAAYYILQSSNNTLRIDRFGQTGDASTVARDYDGDNKADPAVFRPGNGTFYYRGSLNNPNNNVTFVRFGAAGDLSVPGDFDGDGKGDFCVHRDNGGQGLFILLKSSGGVEYIPWGTANDVIVPGDYDGDAKSDFALARPNLQGRLDWYILTRTGSILYRTFGAFTGNLQTTDFPAPGDYDGDGKTDIALWRAGTPTTTYFYVLRSSDNSVQIVEWGQPADVTSASYSIRSRLFGLTG